MNPPMIVGMNAAMRTVPHVTVSPASRFLELVLPKEHGSWSLALEPVALGLLAAPSAGGGWLAVATLAAFLARRPLRAVYREQDLERRTRAAGALVICAGIAAIAFTGVIATAGTAWLGWLTPTLLASAAFVSFDLQNEGRVEFAEVAGAAAFGCLPAVFVILAGGTPATAAALAVLMLGRAIPAVLGVRAYLREMKTGVRRRWPALLTTAVLLVAILGLRRADQVPSSSVLLMASLAVGTVTLLLARGPRFRARTVGMAEMIAGIIFVIVTAVAMHRPQDLAKVSQAMRNSHGGISELTVPWSTHPTAFAHDRSSRIASRRFP